MYQREGLLLPQSDAPQVDEKFVGMLDKLQSGRREVYKDLAVPAENVSEVTNAWRGGIDPELNIKSLDEEDTKKRLKDCVELKQKIRTDTSLDPDLKKAYAWKIDEERANLYMLQASYQGDQKRFDWWNEYIYGKVDSAIYHAALDYFAHVADELIDDEMQPSEVKIAAQNVLDMMSDDMRGYRELLQPDSEVFKAVRTNHFKDLGYYPLLFAGVRMPTSGKVDVVTGDPILQHIIRENLQSDYDIVNAGGATWGVSHRTRSVERPEKYNMPWQRFVGLGPGHEIGSHLLEMENGRRGPVGLFARGLARSERNEGRAVIREQVPYETFEEFSQTVRWRDILRRHIAIGYGAGTNDPNDTIHSSSEVWSFINTIDLMYQTKLYPNNTEQAIAKANARTNTLVLRTLKGTDGQGGAYYKDKLYLEANIACWLEAAIHGAQRIDQGDLFKGDITNPKHILLMQKYRLIPKTD